MTTRYLARRLALSLLTLVLVSVIVFAVAQVLPGNLARTILGPYATAGQVARLNHELGADRPLPVRYGDWLGGFLRGDWGRSQLLNTPVRPLVLDRLGSSLVLAAFALVLVVPLSIALGVLAGLAEGRLLDRVVSLTGVALIAVPEFVAGVILLVVFAVKLQWLPVSSHVPGADPADVVRQLLLPSLPLMFVLFGYIARMARPGTVEALASPYVRTAVLKGLPRRVVVRRHVLRNALLPTVSVVSVQVGYLVGGLVVIETLFDYPGIGQLVYDSARGHDVPVLEATVLLVAGVYLVANLVADLLYVLLDPRLRTAS